jgi:hypothetical protein
LTGTWGAYQSVMQLAVGLNFAYTGLRTVVHDRLPTIQATHARLLQTEQLQRASRGHKGRELSTVANADTYLRAVDRMESVDKIDRRVSVVSPGVATCSGLVSLGLLFVASDRADEKLGGFEVALIFGCGYLWLGFIGLLYLFLRAQLERTAHVLRLPHADIEGANGKNCEG